MVHQAIRLPVPLATDTPKPNSHFSLHFGDGRVNLPDDVAVLDRCTLPGHVAILLPAPDPFAEAACDVVRVALHDDLPPAVQFAGLLHALDDVESLADTLELGTRTGLQVGSVEQTPGVAWAVGSKVHPPCGSRFGIGSIVAARATVDRHHHRPHAWLPVSTGEGKVVQSGILPLWTVSNQVVGVKGDATIASCLSGVEVAPWARLFFDWWSALFLAYSLKYC